MSAPEPETNDTPMPPTITVQEAARYLRISRSAAYELARTGEIPAVRLGGRWRIPRDPFLRWWQGRDLDGQEKADAGEARAAAPWRLGHDEH